MSSSRTRRADQGRWLRNISAREKREVGRILDGMEQPLYQHYFVKRLVTMSMDRGNREKEAAAVLLSRLFRHHVVGEQIQRGFERLLESVDGLAIRRAVGGPRTSPCSSPAPSWTTFFPPSFCTPTSRAFFPGLRVGEKAAECIDLAHGHLATGTAPSGCLAPWGDPEKSPIDAAKAAIQDLLREYLESGDVVEARRCLRSLNARYFHHELVKRALVLCIEAAVGAETAPRLLGLLKVLGDSGEVSVSQMAIGFGRMDAVVDDLKLDVPNAVERMEGLRLMAKEEAIFPAMRRRRKRRDGRQRRRGAAVGGRATPTQSTSDVRGVHPSSKSHVETSRCCTNRR